MLRSAKKIVLTLNAAGFEAYFAGGAIRDQLLNRKTSDVDIATSATPKDIEEIFTKTHPIGREFGVMLVILQRHAFEVASFRGEAEYDGRHPQKIFFTTVEKDAQRRDFTVNGLFYDPVKKRILDFVNGQHDLKLKIIRFIGNPEKRILEDHLRLLRGVRFCNKLNFEYEPKTATAIKKYSHLIVKISGERIRDELNKMMEDGSRAQAVRDLEKFGLLATLLPELSRLKNLPQPKKFHQEGDTWTHSLGSLAALPQTTNIALAWATLLHDIGKAETLHENSEGVHFPGHAAKSAQIAEKILQRLRFDNATRAKIVWLIANHMSFYDLLQMRAAHRHNFFTHPWFADLVKVCAADIRGTRPANFSLHRKIVRMWHTETREKLLPSPSTLLTGDEIARELHLPRGPQIGRLKRILHDAQIENLVSSREEAVRFLEKCLQR